MFGNNYLLSLCHHEVICYFSFTRDCWWRHPLKQVILWWLLPQSRQHSHRNLLPAKAAMTYGPVTVNSTTESGASTIPITLAGHRWTWSVKYTSWSMPPLPNWSTTWPSPPLHLDDRNPIIFVPITIAEAEPTVSVCRHFSYGSDSCSPQLSLSDQSPKASVPTTEGVREMAGDTVREGSGRQVAGGFAHRGKDYLLFQVKWETFRGILAEQWHENNYFEIVTRLQRGLSGWRRLVWREWK